MPRIEVECSLNFFGKEACNPNGWCYVEFRHSAYGSPWWRIMARLSEGGRVLYQAPRLFLLTLLGADFGTHRGVR